jgi:predicted glycogen debranching enzyme
MSVSTRIIVRPGTDGFEVDPLRTREWLVTNGLGGYASGRVIGATLRRYHGILIAALPSPLGRMVMLNHLAEHLVLPGGELWPFAPDSMALTPDGNVNVREFRLEDGLPVWLYGVRGFSLEKRVIMPHHQNTTHVTYRLISGPGPVLLRLRPEVHFRPHDSPVNMPLAGTYGFKFTESGYELSLEPSLPILRLFLYGGRNASLAVDMKRVHVVYPIEEKRGYEAVGNLWSPGYFQVPLETGEGVTLVASTETWEAIFALTPEEATEAEHERRRLLLASASPKARAGPAAELVFAADQFVVTPVGRIQDTIRARASGFEMKTVIAGYHWFTDWGRDTMISLEGLTLATGRNSDAASILRAFGYYLRDGLIPNMFPEGKQEGLYHTADATLWFFHAIDRYLSWTGDYGTLRLLLPKLRSIVAHHLDGTRFNIAVDREDGLLKQGEQGYQLTWMDAKAGDWVVTPRRGKAVEINALWYNALRLLASWTGGVHGNREEVSSLDEWAELARRSFNDRFWCEEKGYLYDVVDGEGGDDASYRPNQVLAISLRYPVLDRDRWEAVLSGMRERLLTPVGLRSLAPDHPDYKPTYYGDVRARDAAYHQGTVWAWLIGPFVDAWLKAYPDDKATARGFLEGFLPHLNDKCVGTIGEIFDGDPPFYPHGCVSQAWSVAEVLRAWIETE